MKITLQAFYFYGEITRRSNLNYTSVKNIAFSVGEKM